MSHIRLAVVGFLRNAPYILVEVALGNLSDEVVIAVMGNEAFSCLQLQQTICIQMGIKYIKFQTN